VRHIDSSATQFRHRPICSCRLSASTVHSETCSGRSNDRGCPASGNSLQCAGGSSNSGNAAFQTNITNTHILLGWIGTWWSINQACVIGHITYRLYMLQILVITTAQQCIRFRNTAGVISRAPNDVQTYFSRICQLSTTIQKRQQEGLEAAPECRDFQEYFLRLLVHHVCDCAIWNLFLHQPLFAPWQLPPIVDADQLNMRNNDIEAGQNAHYAPSRV